MNMPPSPSPPTRNYEPSLPPTRANAEPCASKHRRKEMQSMLLNSHLNYLRMPGGRLLMTIIACGLMILLLLGAWLSPNATAHAHQGASQTCTSTHGTIAALCEGQFPILEHCADDAESVRILPAYVQGVLIGEVDLRHSSTCHTYWLRTMAYGGTNGLVLDVEANI